MSAVPRADDGPADIVVRISSVLPSLAPSEARVGQVIVANPDQAARLTITELASQAATSETTVIRFCRSLGIGGYPELRIALATAAGRAEAEGTPRRSADIGPDDTLADLVAKIGAADVKSVADTVANVDLNEFAKVVSAVAAAGRVDIYAAGATSFVALDFQQKLHRIGLLAFAWSDIHVALPSAANLTCDDVAIGISHSGTTIDTIDALGQARESGATTVAITNFSRSPITHVADLILRTSAQEGNLRSGAVASRIAELTVLDCLFVAVAQQRLEPAQAALERSRASIKSRHRSRVRPSEQLA